MMKTQALMSSPAITASPDLPIRDAASLMRDHDIGVLPVVSGGVPVGVLTDRDIVVRLLSQADAFVDVSVSSAMSAGAKSCFADQDVSEAATIMGDNQVPRLLLTDRSMQLLGILSLGDISENASQEPAGEAPGEFVETR